MTPSTIELRIFAEDRRVAALAAAAVGLTLAEAAIPLPLPGVKPGLANIVTLIVLHRFGWRTAVWVSLLRIVAGGLVLGTFLTPTFVMSLAGGLVSLVALGTFHAIARGRLGPVGLSILAAFAHISAQLAVVSVWLLPGVGLWGILPLFLGAAWLTGMVNGLVVAVLLNGMLAPSSLEATK